jgi:hypothetical protein
VNVNDPITPLLEATGNLHEIYESMLESGFSQHEALYALGVMLASGPPKDVDP